MIQTKLFHNPGSKYLTPGFRSIIALAIVALLAGCAVKKGVPEVAQAYPLKVTKTTFELGFPMPQDGGALVGEHTNRIAFFAQEFFRRTRSPMTISILRDSPNSTSAAEILQRKLIALGLRKEVIVLKLIDKIKDENKALMLSFDGYALKVPECGNWTGHTGSNPTGLPHTNFGCSVTRNLGLMISDPGDLVSPRIAGHSDAPSADRILGAHRTGQPTVSAPPSGEQGTVSSVAGSSK